MKAFIRIFLIILILGLAYLFLRRHHRTRQKKPHEKFRIPDSDPEEDA